MALGKFVPKIRWLLLIVALAIVSVWFYAYYTQLIQSRRAFILNNAFASLSVAADDFSARLYNWGVVVRRVSSTQGQSRAGFSRYMRVLVPGLNPCSSAPPSVDKQPGQSSASRFVAEYSRLSIQSISTSDRTLLFEPVDKGGNVNREFCAQANLGGVLPNVLADAEKLFDDVLLASADGSVLYQLARSGTRLVRLDSVLATASKEAAGSPPSSGKPTGKDNSASSNDRSDSEPSKTAAEQFAQGSDFSNLHEVHFAGEDYFVFVQPAPVLHLFRGVSKEEDSKLLLVGLLRQSRVNAQSAELPMNILAWAMLVFSVLFSIAWTVSSLPGKPQLLPMRHFDVVLVALVAVITVAALTIGVVHAYTTQRFDINTSDEHLRALAKRIDQNVQEELSRFVHVLHAMTASSRFAEAYTTRSAISPTPINDLSVAERKVVERCCLLRNVLQNPPSPLEATPASTSDSEEPLVEHSAEITSIAYSFPFFDYIFWSNPSGRQIAKFSIRKEVTPEYPMGGFSWFTDVVEGRLFQLRLKKEQERMLGCSTVRLHVEPLYSPNTGEYMTLVAAPFAQPGTGPPDFAVTNVCDSSGSSATLGAGLLVAPLSSVNTPIVPPGYGFVIIDRTGRVLYTSTGVPKARENFFRDTAADPELIRRATIGSAGFETVSYRGKSTRLYMTPFASLENAPWTIVTWHDVTQDGLAQLETLRQSLLLLIPHAVLVGILAFLGWRRLRISSASAFWPRRDRAGYYIVLITLTSGASIFLWLLALTASRELVYVGMFFLPAMIAFSTAALLRNRTRRARWLLLPFLLIALINLYQRAAYSRPTDIGLALLAGVFLFIVWRFRFFVANAGRAVCKTSLGGRPLADRWIYIYAAVVCFGLLVTAVIPAVANYRLAYDSVQAANTMQDLVQLSRALERREHSAEQYYRDIQLADGFEEPQRFVADRINSTLDRYDLAVSSREAPREILTEWRMSAMWLDRVANYFGFASLLSRIAKSEANELGDTNIRPRFTTPSPDVIQYEYPSRTARKDIHTDGGPRIQTRRVASKLVSLNDTNLSWIAIALLALIYKVILSTTRFLFLVDLEKPKSFPVVPLEKLCKRAENLVLLGLAGTGKTQRLRQLRDTGCICYIDMGVVARRKELPDVATGANPVVIDHFDLEWTHGDSDEWRLMLLEWLLYEKQATIVLVCVRDPILVQRELNRGRMISEFGEGGDSCRVARWKRVWRHFPQTAIDECTIPKPRPEAEVEWTRRIYASCTRAQRAVLYNLTTEGWINPRNRQAASELVSRGLLQVFPVAGLAPALSWMRPHMGDVIPTEDVEQWKLLSKGTSPASIVVWVLGICAVLLILFVGRDYIQTWAGLFGAVVGALATLWKLVGDMRVRSARAEVKGEETLA